MVLSRTGDALIVGRFTNFGYSWHITRFFLHRLLLFGLLGQALLMFDLLDVTFVYIRIYIKVMVYM